MPSAMGSVLCVSLALLDLALAAPTSSLAKRSFTVNRYAHATRARTAQAALAKSMDKWGLSVDSSGMPNIPILAASDETGEVVNVPVQNDVQFLSPITVGGQSIMMDFDTGSSDL
jgi:aspergillopepsin I